MIKSTGVHDFLIKISSTVEWKIWAILVLWNGGGGSNGGGGDGGGGG